MKSRTSLSLGHGGTFTFELLDVEYTCIKKTFDAIYKTCFFSPSETRRGSAGYTPIHALALLEVFNAEID